jgi:hypothetical protein
MEGYEKIIKEYKKTHGHLYPDSLAMFNKFNNVLGKAAINLVKQAE